MTQPEYVRVKVSDIRPDGSIRTFSQLWERSLCDIQGDIVCNTHTGQTARLMDRIEEYTKR